MIPFDRLSDRVLAVLRRRGDGEPHDQHGSCRHIGTTDLPRHRRGVRWLDDAVRDIGYACRGLLRARGLAVVALASLALGIGANAVIFSVVDAALLRSLPYVDADRLVALLQTVQTLDGDRMEIEMSGRRVDDLRALPQIFERAVGYSDATDLALAEGDDVSLRVGAFSPALPALLGVVPQLGRAFMPEDIDAGDRIVISDAYWQRAFNRDPRAIGATIALASGARVVVGVMPQTFRYFVGARTDAWLPVADRDADNVVARLRPGLSVEQAQRELDAAIASPVASWKPLGVEILPADWNRAGGYFGRGLRSTGTMLYSLLGAVALLLAIGCANVANLLLSRTLARQREIAVRRSLGASRGRVARQFLTEGIVVSVFGSAAALVLAWWGIRVLPAFVPADLAYSMFGVAVPRLDGRVLVFGVAISLVTGLLCGSASAVRVFTSRASEDELTGGCQRVIGPSRAQRRVHGMLQGLQVAMTVVLLTGTGLLLASVHRMASVPPGFDEENLGYARLDFRATGWAGRAGLVQRRAFIDDLIARLVAVPGIAAVTAGPPPVGGYANGGFLPDDSRPSPSTTVRAENYPVRSDFFRVARIALVSGRAFGADDGPSALPVAIINESAARRFWPEGSAVGRRFRQFAGDADSPPLTIVGVVADVRTGNLMREHVQIYRPSAQSFEASEILFRAPGAMAPVIAAIRTAVRDVDARVAMVDAGSVDGLFVERSPLGPVRFYATFLGLFAAIALLTAAIGLYGVLSYAVARRTYEIGVRIALGAGRTRVRWMMAGEVLLPVVAGLAAGIVAALWLSRFIASQLFQVAPRDPMILGAIVLFLVVVSAMAAVVPARRAVRIDPAVALRDE